MDRRGFLEFLGAGAAFAASGQVGAAEAAASAAARSPAKGSTPAFRGSFVPVPFNTDDKLTCAAGIDWRMLARFRQPMTTRGETFGYNNDFNALISVGKDEALLMTNFEAPHALFTGDWEKLHGREVVDLEMAAVGAGIMKMRRIRGEWQLVFDDPSNRRYDGLTKIPFSKGQSIAGSTTAVGTLGNCAGGTTPWGTFLTCEENYQDYYGDVVKDLKDPKDKTKTERITTSLYMWNKHFDYSPLHYGWVVEINPQTGDARKLIALGRFAHEGATVVKAKDDRPVVYMADDAADQYLYKFIADKVGSLDSGTLYAANLISGQWLALDYTRHEIVRGAFQDQTEVLMFCRQAATMLGATPLNRPEDVEVHPRTGDVYVAQTMNKPKNDMFGSILRIRERGQDAAALHFTHEVAIAGGDAGGGFAAPDNLMFDRKGNLWITTDIPGYDVGKGAYAPFGNNGLFYVPITGADAGLPQLVATAPIDAELTGPCLTPDGTALILSVQHPGEYSKGPGNFSSHWPEGGDAVPTCGVVLLSGSLLKKLLS